MIWKTFITFLSHFEVGHGVKVSYVQTQGYWQGLFHASLEFRKSFTASQIKQIYKLSQQRLLDVIAKFGKDQAEQFKCTYRKVFEVIKFDPFPAFKKLVLEFPSQWDYEGIDEVPF